MNHRFKIELEQEGGEEIEVGGDVFPPEPEQEISTDHAYADLIQTGEDRLASFVESEA